MFFVETITKGQADKGGRCPDGTVTVARQGNKLALRWFGSIQDDVVVAYGTLSKSSSRSNEPSTRAERLMSLERRGTDRRAVGVHDHGDGRALRKKHAHLLSRRGGAYVAEVIRGLVGA